MGRIDHTASDSEHPKLFIEAKRRKSYQPLCQYFYYKRKDYKNKVVIWTFKDLVMVHSDDLLALSSCVQKKLTEKSFEHKSIINLEAEPDNARFRPSFKDYHHAAEQSLNEDKIPVLVLKPYNLRGFFLILKKEDLYELANYRAAAILYLNNQLSEEEVDTSYPTIFNKRKRIVMSYMDQITKCAHRYRKKMNDRETTGKDENQD